MKKNQSGFSIVEIVIAIAVLAAVGVGAFLILGRSGSKPTNSGSGHTVSGQTVVEGQVTQIINQGGETCLTYVINTRDYVAVGCPSMAGQDGFSGNYDKNIQVGNKVTARGTPKSTTRQDHKTYHLNSPGSYLRLAE